MAAPPKPWERPGTNFQNSSPLPSSSMSASIGSDSVQRVPTCCASPSSSASSNPPRVPPRPSSQQSSLSTQPGLGYSSFGGYGGYSSSPYGYGGGGYGGMYNSAYSSYGNYGSYGGYNRMGDVQSAFARHAEENSRPAFESIHSIVNAVNSVGMMLDSTFQAVYNSFRAVIGVADNFTRLKTQLVQVFSALAFIRTLRYIYRRLLELLWLKPRGEADRKWMEAFEAAAIATAGPGDGPKKSSWPILMFFGIIMGGPYLIWKLISAFSATSTDEDGWMSGLNDHFVARANYNFQGQSSEELSFSAGQNINIAPKDLQPRVRGWLLASVDGKSSGMIPANYVTVLGKRRGTKTSSQPLEPSSQQAESTLPMPSAFNTAPQQIPNLQDNELDSVFSGASLSSTDVAAASASAPDGQDFSDSSNRDASDILNDVDKGS